MSDGQIKVDYIVNASEFNKNVAQMKRNMQLCTQEVKNSAKEVNLYGSNIQTLTAKQQAIKTAISQSEKIIAQYSQNIDKNKTALASNRTELEKLAAKKKEANKAYQEAVKAYGKESDEAKKLKQSLDQVSGEYDTMKDKVKNNEKNIISYTNQIEKQKGTLIDLKGQLKATNEELEKQSNKFIQASQKFADYGGKLQNLGTDLNKMGTEVQKAGATIVTAAAGLATLGAGFETGLVKVNSLAKDSKEGLANYGEAVMNLSNDTGTATGEMSEAIYQALSSGIAYADSLSFITEANKTSVGGYTDLTSAVSLLTTIMNVFGMTAEDTGNISDKLFYTQNAGVTTIDALSKSMGNVVSTANSYNVSLDNVLAGYVSLTKGGINTAEATTKLRSMIQELGDTGSNTGKILQEKTGKSFTALMEEGNSLFDVLKIVEDSCEGNQDAFNNLWSSTEAGQASMAILNENVANFNGSLSDLQNSAGLTDDAFNAISETSEFKFKKSLNEVKNSLTKLGDSLLPLMDEASKGISKVADVISKMNPKTVQAVAKFGALALVFGTVMKATGSLVTVLGKGMTGISGLLKIAADTKSLGSFTKALGQSEGAVGTLTKSLGGLSSTGGAIGLAITGVAALGVALYANQKDILDSEKRYDELGGKLGEFSGRLRSNESVWTEIFGKEYSWKFSEEYKTALDNAETDVSSWVETLKGYQDQIYAILNSTEINQQTKDEQVATLVKDTIGAGNIDSQVSSITTGMKEKGFSQEQINSTVENFKKSMEGAYKEIGNVEGKALDLLKEHTTTSIDEMGNQITTVDMEAWLNDLQPSLDAAHNSIVTSQQTDYDDCLEIAQRYADEENIIHGDSLKGTLEYNKKSIESTKEAKLKEIEALRENAKEHGQLTDEYKKTLAEKEDSINKLADAQSKSLQRMALYDEEYAEKNDLTVKKLNENSYMIKDNLSGISTIYFDNIEALNAYADATGSTTATVTDATGNMHTVIVDATGNIVGMLDEGAATFGYFADEATTACNKVIEQAGLTSGTAEQKFAAICNAIDDGTLSAEQFGMTDEEFKAAADAMLNASGDATTLKNKMNEIPKNVSSKVEVTGIDTATTKTEGLLTKLGSLVSKVWTPTISVITGGLGGKALGGTVNNGEIFNVNEQGPELFDSASATAYSLDSVGESAYLPMNTRVSNALLTTQKMQGMVNKEVSVVIQGMSKNIEDSIINAFSKVQKGSNGNFTVNMNNPHFENKGSENANINNVKRIIGSIK